MKVQCLDIMAMFSTFLVFVGGRMRLLWRRKYAGGLTSAPLQAKSTSKKSRRVPLGGVSSSEKLCYTECSCSAVYVQHVYSRLPLKMGDDVGFAR